ncbi:MAG TPA: glycoside hydrolase family 125 protein [Roseiflexaceae bacterium]|nr:glycoside hydrolase family 125 protein [Roseiflexaceae bacterium]
MTCEPFIQDIERRLAGQPRRAALFRACFTNTLATTIRRMPDGTTFVITGDIPAMWLRDSAAQVRPYLVLAARDADISDMIAGVVRRQMRYITIDPYANAFNEEPNGRRWDAADETEMNDWLWERKYEVDSLCYPLQLAYLLWRATGRTDHFDATFCTAAAHILETWRREQHHALSPYRFVRRNGPPGDTLSHEGYGAPVAMTGMTWSGFRPSDDACVYGYLVPANMFAAVTLGYLAEVAGQVLGDTALRDEARALAAEIRAGVERFGTVQHPDYGRIYAYETDGLGNYTLMDDANVPSLLSLPYLGWCAPDDPLYLATRRFVLSPANPFFYRGTAAEGVGSPHTPPRYIWHIALAVQGLTATDPAERERMLALMERTDGGAGMMHEGFDADDPAKFTRPWFSWANMMYCELVLASLGLYVPGSPLVS